MMLTKDEKWWLGWFVIMVILTAGFLIEVFDLVGG